MNNNKLKSSVANNNNKKNKNQKRQSRSRQRSVSFSRTNQNTYRNSRARNSSRSTSRRRNPSRSSRSVSRRRSFTNNYRNYSQKRKSQPTNTTRVIHVPKFSGNPENCHTISSQTFEVIIVNKTGNQNEYRPIEYLLMALYFSMWAGTDGRTLTNNKTKENRSLYENVSISFSHIFSKFPGTTQSPTTKITSRIKEMFGLISHWVTMHLYDGNSELEYTKLGPSKSEWHLGYYPRASEPSSPKTGNSSSRESNPIGIEE